jgi:hypothetical protein
MTYFDPKVIVMFWFTGEFCWYGGGLFGHPEII